jgi:hypothetical protein
LPPCSKFKIWNTLIGLENVLISSLDEPFYQWDGKERSIPDWNWNHTLKEAFQVSCVPAYQNLARRIGAESMRSWLEKIEEVEREVVIQFDQREVVYDYGELDEIAFAYAITIHKSQGSEFPVVVIPLATQHYLLLQRNLVYTGITRGKKLVVLIGQRKAMGMAVRNDRRAHLDTDHRWMGIAERRSPALRAASGCAHW